MLKIGSILQGRYRVQRLLGSGGFGAVYYAEDLRLAGRPVAIKHFYTAHLSQQEAVEMAAMFQSEAHTLARLNHPNLSKVFDYFDEGSDWFLVMEFVPGETLLARLKRVGQPFAEVRAIEWGIELSRVLHYLHNQHPPLIFRDLKPANIMVTPDERLILIDFGIVRSFKQGQARDTFQIGTPGYAPPEQYGGQTEPRSDLYSLGATLHTLLTGERPTGESFALTHLSERAPWVSPALADLIFRLTAYHVEDRPASAAVVQQELEALRQQVDLEHRQPARVGVQARIAPQRGSGATVLTLPPPVAPLRQRSTGALVMLALLLTVAAGFGALYASGLLRLSGWDSGAAGGGTRPAGASEQRSTPATGRVAPQELLISTSTATNNNGDITDRDIMLLPLDGSQPQRLISGPSFDYFGNRNLEGRIAFTRAVSDAEEHICVAAPDGSNVRQLTSGETINRAAVWSPDGRILAFESNRHSGNFNERDIFLMNVDGEEVRQLTYMSGWQGGPAWSPDGKFIVFHTREKGGRYQLAVVNVESGDIRQLVALPDEDLFWPSWSPDGRTIAFMISGESATDKIALISASGGVPQMLDAGGGANRWPRWSPDGSLLAFESSREGFFRIYLYSLESRETRLASTGVSDDRWPGW